MGICTLGVWSRCESCFCRRSGLFGQRSGYLKEILSSSLVTMVMRVGIYILCTDCEEKHDAFVDVDDFGMLFVGAS